MFQLKRKLICDKGGIVANHLRKLIEKMREENLDDLVIQSFTNSYYKILEGATGKIKESEIEPPSEDNLIDYEKISASNYPPINKLAVIKLNGGLGTSMGLKKAKTLLKIKGNDNFLDIIAKQILHLRKESRKKIPLLFMHSFNTQKDSLFYLRKYNDLALPKIPLDFLQNKFPKIKQNDLSAFENENDELTWNPPGHGEIYMAMEISGVLNILIKKGYKYAFISNSDNLGAVVDEKILSYFAKKKIPFMMEVCKRTAMDKKGGHLAQTKKGQLLLRETAQCPANEMSEFQDVQKYKFFNTNNLWVNLKALKHRLYEKHYHLPLSLILNSKEIDGEKIFQIETAMGSAINVFQNSKAIIVNRDRFIPVKTTNDLLAIWSDAYELKEDYTLKCLNAPHIKLNDKYYKHISDFEKHFKKGVPSLKKCNNLKIDGDVKFGKNVEIIGNVKIAKDMKLSNIVLKKDI